MKNKKHNKKHNKMPKCPWIPDDYTPPPKNKFLGYCKCGNIISSADLESKNIFNCPSCHYRATKGKLKEPKQREILTKKDWKEVTSVQSAVEINHDLDPNTVKVVE